MPEADSHRFRVAVALAIVYLLWGSSYLATKVMVTDEPPLVAAGLRHVVIWNVGPIASTTPVRDMLRLGVLVRRLRKIPLAAEGAVRAAVGTMPVSRSSAA